jgi:hypothetical protein
MASNLTGSTIASSYSQLLHIDGGPAASEKVVYSGTGTATALKLGTGSASVDNLKLDGNTLSSTNTNGDINLTPNGTGTVVVSKANIQSGTIVSNNATITGGAISNVTFTGTFSGITSIESDIFTTKNGGDGVTLEDNEITADGASANINLKIAAKGTGEITHASKFGYQTGTGGTVTQATSRTTGVTLDKLSGAITLFSASISGHASEEFTVTNNTVAATDVIIVNIKSGATSAQYTTQVTAVSAGSFKIAVQNQSNSATPTESPVLSFVVIKGVTS